MESSDLYYKEIRHCDLLTADSERKLFADYRTCSKCQYNYTEPASVACCPVCSTPRNFDARKRLVTGSVRYVAKVARDYLKHARGERHGEDLLLALVSAGNLGLLVAIDRFDLSRGTRFLTYAAWWVREKILEELDSMGSVRVPAYQLKASRAKWRAGNGQDDAGYGVVAVSSEFDDEPAPESDTIDVHLENGRQYLSRVFYCTKLTAKERYVILLSYGLRERPKTLRQVATRLNVSAESIRHMKVRALQKLGAQFSKDDVASTDDIF